MYYQTNINKFIITFLLALPRIYSNQANTHTEKLHSNGYFTCYDLHILGKTKSFFCCMQVTFLMLKVFNVRAGFVLGIQTIRVKAITFQTRSLPRTNCFLKLCFCFSLFGFVGFFLSCYTIKGFILIFKNVACIFWRIEKRKRDPWSLRAAASV